MVKPKKNSSRKPHSEKKLTFAQADRIAKKQAFLQSYPEYGTIWHTAKALGIGLRTVEDWLDNDAAFAESFKSIRKVPGYLIERTSMNRCVDKNVQADTLRIFMLKNLLPDAYGEADKLQIELTVSNVLVAQFISIVQQNVPDTCPHCKTNLGLSSKVASELKALSESMLKAGAMRESINARAQEV